MRLRLFRAARMQDAMAALRAELGPDAVILSTRRVAGGVEVTAALEPEELDEEPVLIPPPRPEPPPALAAPPPPSDHLTFHSLPPALAARLRTGPLERMLGEALSFQPLPDGVARPLLLAGPPGAGKTLTCAKLAARAVMAGGPPPLVASTDLSRAGATAQLAAFTAVLGLTLAVAQTPGALGKAVQRRAEGAAAFIDTAGCDPFDPAQVTELVAVAAAVQADIALVLPAGMDPAEAADIARAFAAIGARCLVPTRLDVARRLGGVLAAAAAGPLALAEAGTGPGAADGLTPLSPEWLAPRLRNRGPGAAVPAIQETPAA
jgi:flagellar biosynthesis protein FlhF